MDSIHQQPFLFEPLLLPEDITTSATTTSNVDKDVGHVKAIITSSSDIVFRFVCLFLVGTISLWANYEASKGFNITIINDAGDSFAGRRFSYLYVSDDSATRIVLDTSKFVEDILYPSDHARYHQTRFFKKQVDHVILRLANQNMTTDFAVESRANNEYVLHLNPSTMTHKNFNHAIVSAIRHGMARIWLWDGHGTVPQPLTNGTMEYISSGFQHKILNLSQNSSKNNMVAEMLVDCVKQNSGFVRELNQAMRDHWHDSTVDYSSVDVKSHANICNYKLDH